MGELRWKNNSSFVVDWFFITADGSPSASLKPGEEYRCENNQAILQIGMHCRTAPVYIIQSLRLPDGVDAYLLASDIIPM